MKRWIVKVGFGIVGIVLAVVLWWALAEGPLRNPNEALQDFFEARNRAEDQLMNPLILNGHKVVPLVLSEIPKKDMRLRRYAIGFLGNGHYAEAMPEMEKILSDDSEIFYFRADALLAIYEIAPDRARKLAPQYTSGRDLLGKVAQDIVAGRNPVRVTRSYWEALASAHD